MTLGTIRAFIRSFLDSDELDMPDALLDVFIEEGYVRVAKDQKEWPFYETSTDLVTVSGTQSYTLDGELPVLDVSSIRTATGERLEYLDHDDAESSFQSTSSGTPTAWSTWGGSLYLWPTPTGETLSVRGYRAPSDTWIDGGTGATPDLPADMHMLVCQWALVRCYEQQDDPELGSYHRQAYESGLKEQREALLSGPPRPMIVNRMAGSNRNGTALGMARMIVS